MSNLFRKHLLVTDLLVASVAKAFETGLQAEGSCFSLFRHLENDSNNLNISKHEFLPTFCFRLKNISPRLALISPLACCQSELLESGKAPSLQAFAKRILAMR